MCENYGTRQMTYLVKHADYFVHIYQLLSNYLSEKTFQRET